MGTRETTFEERRRLALGLPPEEDVDDFLETAPLDESTDGQPLAANEDPTPDPEGARSEEAGMEDSEEESDEEEKPKRRGRKAKEE